MDQCVWVVLRLGEDDEKLRRILKNHEVRKVQTIIETVQAQSNDLIYPHVLGLK